MEAAEGTAEGTAEGVAEGVAKGVAEGVASRATAGAAARAAAGAAEGGQAGSDAAAAGEPDETRTRRVWPVEIAAGGEHTLVRMSNDELWAFGSNGSGALGLRWLEPDQGDKSLPARVEAPKLPWRGA